MKYLEDSTAPLTRAPCAHYGCKQQPAFVRTWRTESMPTVAFYYYCADHDPAKTGQGAE